MNNIKKLTELHIYNMGLSYIVNMKFTSLQNAVNIFRGAIMTIEETLSKMYNFLTTRYVREDALDMLLSINGDNVETYKDALYYLTGYRDFDQIEKDFYK